MSDATIETVAAALREMASGFEHMCQRMDEMLEKWEAASNRTLEILEEQRKLRAAQSELNDRVTALEVKNRQRRRTKRLKEQAA